jgi:LacI family transcriptional regulator
LPTPCGVFAANDRIAGCIVAAALKAGLAVPQDIAVVGVDNDIGQCETLPVSVSSVSLDREGIGHAAAGLLSAMMEGGCHSAGSIDIVGAMHVVRRASTRRFVDRRVAAAVEHIRKHACDGVTVPDVVGVMGCSRSLAYLRFAEEVGHSILEEIQTVRIAHAEELLRKGTLSVDAVGDFSGYSSTSEFRRAFKHRTGLSPMAYAREHRNSCSKK